MSGRWPNPGEASSHSLMDQSGIHNRTLRCQVTNVDNKNGFIRLTYNGLAGGIDVATVPPIWMSLPKATGNAAWGRYMPQESDILKVSFDYDDRPRIVGYDVIGGDGKTANGDAGWPAVNNLYEIANKDPTTKKQYTDSQGNSTTVSLAKYANFIPLNPGEYDFMSSGGAYIYGTNVGKLYLAGGTVAISLIKNEMLMSSVAQLFKHTAEDCTLRVGQVRRTTVASQGLDQTIPTDVGGLYKEFSVFLNTLASLQLGNVVNDTGIPNSTGTLTEQLSGQDLRYLLRTAYMGAQGFEMAVDALGNCQITGASTAVTGFKINYPSGTIEFDALNAKMTVTGKIDINATGNTTITGTNVSVTANGVATVDSKGSTTVSSDATVTVKAPMVNLGGSGGTPVACLGDTAGPYPLVTQGSCVMAAKVYTP